MVEPPEQEGEVGPVPEAAQHHRDDEVAALLGLTAPVAAERDVEVVAEPARQRHVPAPPELLDGGRGVGAVEVVGEPDPQEHRDADGDVGVPGEVGVDLHRVRPRADEQLPVPVLAGRDEHRVHDRGGQVVRDDHLLEQAAADQPDGPDRVHRLGVPAATQLRDELRDADDRSGDQVREEGQVDREVERGDRLLLTAVDVDDVGDGAEQEERDADRERDLDEQGRGRQPERAQQRDERVDEESVVLEEAEQREVEGDPDDHPGASCPVAARTVHARREHVVADRAGEQQEHEPPVPPAVEQVRGAEHEPAPLLGAVVEAPRHAQDDDEEQRERHRREQHGPSPPSLRRRTVGQQ